MGSFEEGEVEDSLIPKVRTLTDRIITVVVVVINIISISIMIIVQRPAPPLLAPPRRRYRQKELPDGYIGAQAVAVSRKMIMTP
jgi:hypothetical protein